MNTRAITILALLAVAHPALSSAQGRTAADYMAAIEGAQSEPGPNEVGGLTIGELMERFKVPGVSIAIGRSDGAGPAPGRKTADRAQGEVIDGSQLEWWRPSDDNVATDERPGRRTRPYRKVPSAEETHDDDPDPTMW